MNEQRCREIVNERSMGRCEMCGRSGHSIHHRNKQGRVWDPANTMRLCGDGTRYCHGWAEANPTHAMTLGLWVPRAHDPATWPVLAHPTGWYRAWWQFDSDGMLHFVHDRHPDQDALTAAMDSFSKARDVVLVLPPWVCV